MADVGAALEHGLCVAPLVIEEVRVVAEDSTFNGSLEGATRPPFTDSHGPGKNCRIQMNQTGIAHNLPLENPTGFKQ